MSGGSAGGMSGGGGGGTGGVRGMGGQMPGTGAPSGGAGGTGGVEGQAGGQGNCGPDMPGGVGGMPGACDEQGAGGVGQYPGETEAERKARLEKTLEESVGGFDEVLAEEQREISTVGRDTEGFGGGGSGGRVGLGKQAAGASGGVQGAGEVADTSAANAGGSASPSLEGLSEEEIEARTPDDIPTLVGEDIVAKQLREAALSEDDPELRERLWEEYRNYNNL
jgi:hypothetical protein